MNIHEYQAKAILRKFGVPVPDGHVCYNSASAREWAKRLGDGPWVVKAQIHAGGRGKGGGVKLARTPDEVRHIAREMLGMTLAPTRPVPKGKLVTRVLVENGCNIASELYVSLVVDRGTSRVTVMASTEGGMDIEEVAAKTPEKIFTEAIDPLVGLTPFQCRKIAFSLGLTGKLTGKAVKVLQGLYTTFIACDCSMLEINPLVVTGGRRAARPGCQIRLRRQRHVPAPQDRRHARLRRRRPQRGRSLPARPLLHLARRQHRLPGKRRRSGHGHHGHHQALQRRPANFLDVGGGATIERVTEAFKIILSDKNVKGILVNIFGGIMKCDVIATGVIEAAKQVGIKVPLVVRLEGTNVELGKEHPGRKRPEHRSRRRHGRRSPENRPGRRGLLRRDNHEHHDQ